MNTPESTATEQRLNEFGRLLQEVAAELRTGRKGKLYAAETMETVACNLFALAPSETARTGMPVELYDGASVYASLTDRELTNMTPQHVDTVLRAVVRLMRKNAAPQATVAGTEDDSVAVSAPAGAASPPSAAAETRRMTREEVQAYILDTFDSRLGNIDGMVQLLLHSRFEAEAVRAALTSLPSSEAATQPLGPDARAPRTTAFGQEALPFPRPVDRPINDEEWEAFSEVLGKWARLCKSVEMELTAARSATAATIPIEAEVARAVAKFPTWPTDPLHALAVLGEEFGELTKAMLQLTYEPHKSSAEEVRTEALQTAAMALRHQDARRARRPLEGPGTEEAATAAR